MGGFGSSRWKHHLKRVCVEECQRERADSCPLCGAPVVWVFQVPRSMRYFRDVASFEPGCRACLRLTYRSSQTWGTRVAEIAKSPAARGALDAEVARQAATVEIRTEAPPKGLGKRAAGRWLREREAARTNFARLLELQNSLPPASPPAPGAGDWLQSGFIDELRAIAHAR